MVRGIENYSARVHLSGYNAWVVALYFIAFGSLVSVIIMKDNSIICYTCLALIILLTSSIIIPLIIIAIRESKVTPNIPHLNIIVDSSRVRNAMEKQEEAAGQWRS